MVWWSKTWQSWWRNAYRTIRNNLLSTHNKPSFALVEVIVVLIFTTRRSLVAKIFFDRDRQELYVEFDSALGWQ